MDPKNPSPKNMLYASDKSWIDGNAITQLKGVSELDGMESVIGFPDLHPGKGGPVGAAFASKDKIYPGLIGNDAGCGICMLQADDLLLRKIKLDKWADKLTDLDSPWTGNKEQWLMDHNVWPDLVSDSLGLSDMEIILPNFRP